MAYCVQCGNNVGDHDLYCAKCGAKQKTAPPPPPGPPFPNVLPNMASNPFAGITDKNVSVLCYVPWLGWIAAILILATDYYRSRDRVSFHAFQALYLFAAWLLMDWVFVPMLHSFGYSPFFPGRPLESILKLTVLGAWIFMLVRVANNDDYHLPVIGDLAERSVSEQRL